MVELYKSSINRRAKVTALDVLNVASWWVAVQCVSVGGCGTVGLVSECTETNKSDLLSVLSVRTSRCGYRCRSISSHLACTRQPVRSQQPELQLHS